MPKYLVLIDTDNPGNIQVFAPQGAALPETTQVPASIPAAPVQAAIATMARTVTKAKVAKPRRAAAPSAPDEDGTVWVTVADAARQLGLTPSAVHYQIKVGGLISRKTAANLREVTQASVDAFKAGLKP